MSDLAPFVAAALRDKVVVDLHEENKELRELQERSQRVVIGMKDSSVVFANGLLQDAERVVIGTEDTSVVFSDGILQNAMPCVSTRGFVKLNLTQHASCPVRDLCKLHIHVGGHHKVDFTSLEHEEDVLKEKCKYDSETDKSLILSVPGRRFGLLVIVHGWPRGHWSGLLGRQFPGGPQGVMDFLVNDVSTRFPQAEATFELFGFDCILERRVLENLPEAARNRLLQGLEPASSAGAEGGNNE